MIGFSAIAMGNTTGPYRLRRMDNGPRITRTSSTN